MSSLSILKAAFAACERRGVPVTYTGGWETRGHGTLGIQAQVGHHTAGGGTADAVSLKTVTSGRPDLSGPLANVLTGRSGRLYAIASGKAYHAGTVNDNRFSNEHAVGNEMENNGIGEGWPAAQLDAAIIFHAEVARAAGIDPVLWRGHKEVCSPKGRKIDPANLDLTWFRDQVVAAFRDSGRRWIGAGGQAPAAPAPVATPAPQAPANQDLYFRWNLGAGNYYGNRKGPNESHGGGVVGERPFVKRLQQRFIQLGCVHGVGDINSSWADGIWEDATDEACRTWHNRFYPGQPQTAQIWSDDHAILFGRAVVPVTPAPAPAPAPAPQAAPAPVGPRQIRVDGALGPETIDRLQEILRTPRDGRISNPSEMVTALQNFLNAHGAHLVVDGKGLVQNGKPTNTNGALQAYLGTPVDKILSTPRSECIVALQNRLNQGWF